MSHTPKDNGQDRRAPTDPRALAEEIERTRAEVGDTVESLTARTHLRDQARQRAGDVADRAKERIGGRSGALRHAGEQFRGRIAERAGGRGDRTGEATPEQVQQRAQQRAQDATRQVAGTLRRNRRQVACAAMSLLAARWFIRRRRHRRADRAG
ncbi:MAG TPA: DUF3618 domain-containing protein [Mycobacteriales bacterium]|nr:DUF3618 domain-containing protein [Mycobacteriales bacterium]